MTALYEKHCEACQLGAPLITEEQSNELILSVPAWKKEFHDGPLFISKRGQRISPRTVQLRLKKLFRSVSSGSGFTPHLMRHTFATHLILSLIHI